MRYRNWGTRSLGEWMMAREEEDSPVVAQHSVCQHEPSLLVAWKGGNGEHRASDLLACQYLSSNSSTSAASPTLPHPPSIRRHSVLSIYFHCSRSSFAWFRVLSRLSNRLSRTLHCPPLHCHKIRTNFIFLPSSTSRAKKMKSSKSQNRN